MKRLLTLLAAAIVSVAIPSAAGADPVRIHLAVTMEEGIGGDPADVFGVPLPPGSTFTGVFVYDPTTPDADPSGTGFYRTGQLSLSVGWGVQSNMEVVVTNQTTHQDPFRDLFTGQGDFSAPDFLSTLIFLHFVSPPTAISTDALPATADAFVAAFPRGQILISAQKRGVPGLGFDLRSHELQARVEASAVPTPEPGSVLLLGTGLVGLVRTVRRSCSA